jgi:hypothetical protein
MSRIKPPKARAGIRKIPIEIALLPLLMRSGKSPAP